MTSCSKEKPWGLHLEVRNDTECARCGWTAPGPISDAFADEPKQLTVIKGGAEEHLSSLPVMPSQAAA